MANAKKCDRCGAFYIDENREVKIRNESFDKVVATRLDKNYVVAKYDLCDNCCRDFLDFMKNKQS